jgi:hypothetical protein
MSLRLASSLCPAARVSRPVLQSTPAPAPVGTPFPVHLPGSDEAAFRLKTHPCVRYPVFRDRRCVCRSTAAARAYLPGSPFPRKPQSKKIHPGVRAPSRSQAGRGLHVKKIRGSRSHASKTPAPANANDRASLPGRLKRTASRRQIPMCSSPSVRSIPCRDSG